MFFKQGAQCLFVSVVGAVWQDRDVLLVNLRSDDTVELAHVSLQVEGATGGVFKAGQTAPPRDLDGEFGQGVVGQTAGLVVRGC